MNNGKLTTYSTKWTRAEKFQARMNGFDLMTSVWQALHSTNYFQIECKVLYIDSPHFADDGACLLQVSIYSSKVLSLCWGSGEDLFSSGPEGAVVSYFELLRRGVFYSIAVLWKKIFFFL